MVGCWWWDFKACHRQYYKTCSASCLPTLTYIFPLHEQATRKKTALHIIYVLFTRLRLWLRALSSWDEKSPLQESTVAPVSLTLQTVSWLTSKYTYFTSLKTGSDLFITILIVNIFDHESAINNDVKTMMPKRKHRNFCANKLGDDWRHSTLGSGCLRTQRRGYVQTDDNENLLCSVIVCNPLPPPRQTRVALSQESRATTLLALGNGGDLKLAPKKKKLIWGLCQELDWG